MFDAYSTFPTLPSPDRPRIACYALSHEGTLGQIRQGVVLQYRERRLDFPVLAAIPCLVSQRAGDRVFFLRDRGAAHELEIFGDSFLIGSARGYDAELSRNIAAAYRERMEIP